LRRQKALQGLHDAAQLLLQILSNPALSDIGSTAATISIPLSIILAKKNTTYNQQDNLPILKNILYLSYSTY